LPVPYYVYSATAVIIAGIASVAVALPSYSAEPSAGEDAHAQISNKASAPAETMLTEAQIEALLREIGLGRDRAKEALPPETKAAVLPPTTALSGAEREALRKMSLWYASRTEAAPKPRPKTSSPRHSASRRYWHHSYDPAAADRGEATRLMTDELRERGVAVERSSRPKPVD
jgi:hypothetical protein